MFEILERLTEPERGITFRVVWTDDNGNVQVNKGYRYQFNSYYVDPVRNKIYKDVECTRLWDYADNFLVNTESANPYITFKDTFESARDAYIKSLEKSKAQFLKKNETT